MTTTSESGDGRWPKVPPHLEPAAKVLSPGSYDAEFERAQRDGPTSVPDPAEWARRRVHEAELALARARGELAAAEAGPRSAAGRRRRGSS